VDTCGRHAVFMQTLRHLVCGTDFSDCAERGIALAITLARAPRAHVTLVHVCEFGEADLDDARLLECSDALSEVVVRHQHCGVELSAVLRSGKPWEKLDNVAAEVGAALIVIGRQGASRERSAGIGSVAERLLRGASRPVLTVPFSF
jgi:nucleotide-binding universal stress UspA family protein